MRATGARDDARPGTPVLEVRVLGGLDLRRGEERLALPESGRAQSLLALVLVQGDVALARERLAASLWPDSTDGQARTNLRHLVHTLRRASTDLDEYLEVTPQSLRWRWELPCWVDVAAFDAALARADAQGISEAVELAALREAVDLHAGDLLEGSYDEWLVEERERLRDRATAASRRLVELLAQEGQTAEAIRRARELVRIDPLHEDGYRVLMRLHDGAGDRAAAVRVFHECSAVLDRELAVEPSAATRAVYAALVGPVPAGAPGGPDEQSDAAGVGAAATPAGDGARVGGAALVGRADEWAWLTDRWRAVEHGGAHLALVTGEPGVGKTRLVEELAAWCAHRGAVVAEGRSYPGEGELGYEVATSWLRARDLAGALRKVAPSDAADLARLLPELDAPRAPDVGALDPTEHRRRLFEAVGRVLAASGRPTLLVVDDAQWCDAQSLQLVHYLVRLDRGPLLVVATVRLEDVDDAHPLGPLASGLRVIDRTSELALHRLDRSDTDELARRLAGPDLDAASLDALYAETEGNPLFVVEALRAGPDHAARDPSGLTPKVQAVIGGRLRQLSEPARDLLGVAATVGREFTTDVLGDAARATDVSLVGGLDELWRRGIIRERGTDGYDFAHGRIRDVAYESLSPATRRRNHARIAAALVGRHGHDLDTVSGEVARHHDRGGQTDLAQRWYRRAAVQARRLHANVEAVRLLRRALELVEAQPDGSERRRDERDVLVALATPLAVVEGFASERLEAVQRRALELSELDGIDPDPSVVRSMVMSKLCRRDPDGARAVAADLRAVAERAGDDLLLVETEYLLGIGAFWAGAFAAARGHFERVVATSDPTRRAEHLLRFGHDPAAVCQSRLANTLWFLGDDDAARAARAAAVTLASEVGQPFTRGVVDVFAALLAVDLGDGADVRRHVAALPQGSEHHTLANAVEAFTGYLAVLDGAVAEGLARIRAAMDANVFDHAPGQRATAARLLLAAHAACGDPATGLAAADDALALDGTRIWEAEIRRLRAGFLAAIGTPDATVAAELDRATEVARAQGAPGLERRVAQTRAEL
jgi:DNA-binding SARP family transcriptional activator